MSEQDPRDKGTSERERQSPEHVGGGHRAGGNHAGRRDCGGAGTGVTSRAGGKPNILVIFGDDIGQTNVSAYSMGLMGYRTPNIDRIAAKG